MGTLIKTDCFAGKKVKNGTNIDGKGVDLSNVGVLQKVEGNLTPVDQEVELFSSKITKIILEIVKEVSVSWGKNQGKYRHHKNEINETGIDMDKFHNDMLLHGLLVNERLLMSPITNNLPDSERLRLIKDGLISVYKEKIETILNDSTEPNGFIINLFR